jgi:hypothetical protein
MLAAEVRDVDGSDGIGGPNPVPHRFAFHDHAFCAVPCGTEIHLFDPSFRNYHVRYSDLEIPDRYTGLTIYERLEIGYFLYITKMLAYDNQPGDNWPPNAEQHSELVDWLDTANITQYPRADGNYRIVIFDGDHMPEFEAEILHKEDF